MGKNTKKRMSLSGCGMVLFFCASFARGQEMQPESSIEDLRRAAKAEIAEKDVLPAKEEPFTSGAMGLQALNPEISITGDMLWSYTDSEATGRKSDFLFRGLGIHAEAYLDPFTRFKAAFSVGEDETRIGEAYMTRFGLLPQVNLTLGKFRQQFGVVNRWHKHGLDQVDFPLALRRIFGPAGLNQTGGSVEWTMSELAGNSQELVVQITDGENAQVFNENADNTPSGLFHYKLFRDLSPSTYAELGFTGLYGRNNEWTLGESTIDAPLDVWVWGLDFTVLWEPINRMRYRSVTWRTEAYALNKEILAPDGSGEDTVDAWGLYSSIEAKISRTFSLGVRGDYFVPDSKDYAASAPASMAATVASEDGANRWQIGPYLTWYQSPFVHFRVEYDYQDGNGTGPAEKVVWLQCIFAAGPHKHERY
jgi:hypothetical protein